MALTQISTEGIKNGTITGTDLATNVDLVDNQKIRFGTGNDLQIYHDPQYGHSFIKESGPGALIFGSDLYEFYNAAISEKMLTATENGAVELYHDNSKKFETLSGGVAVTGSLSVANHITLPDQASGQGKIKLGDGVDFLLYHNGTNSVIENRTGSLIFYNNTNELAAKFIPNGAVELYHDNTKRFETSATGIDITGKIKATSNIEINTDNTEFRVGASDDFKISHSSSENINILRSDSPTVFRNHANNETLAKLTPNGSVELYHDNTKRIETTSYGARVYGNLENHNDDFVAKDNCKFSAGNSGDLTMYHDGNNSYIDENGTGNLRIRQVNGNGIELIYGTGTLNLKTHYNGGVDLYYTGDKKFETTSTGAKISSTAATLRLASTSDQQTATIEMTSSSNESQIGSIKYNHANSSIVSGYLEAFLIDGTETNLAVKVDGAIKIPDSGTKDAKLLIGASDDLQIYHDGTHSRIQNLTGFLALQTNSFRLYNAAGSENMINGTANGAVELYYDNSKKFETTSGGASVTGTLSCSSNFTASGASNSLGNTTINGGGGAGGVALKVNYSSTDVFTVSNLGVVTLTGNLDLQDNDKIMIGTGDDLQIYHNGSGSYIQDSGTGELILKSNSISFTNAAENEHLARFFQDSGVELYNNGTKKFATGGSGVYHDNNGTLSQNAIHFERGQNTGDYSTIFGVTNYPDASGYGDQDDGYWAAVHSKGGMVVVLNTDGGRNDGRNNHDHFSIYHRANNSSSGKRAFSVDHTGGIQCGKAGINIDREWENQPSFSMTRDCNDGTNNTDNNAYFRFHGTGRTHAQWTGGSSGNDFSANMLLDGGNYNASDRRAKTDIVDCPYGLDVVNKLKPRKYQLVNSQLEPQGDDNINLGFIAQEIMEHIPECVNYLGDKANTPNEKGFARAYALDTNEIVAVLTKAIQELAAKVAVLESKT